MSDEETQNDVTEDEQAAEAAEETAAEAEPAETVEPEASAEPEEPAEPTVPAEAPVAEAEQDETVAEAEVGEEPGAEAAAEEALEEAAEEPGPVAETGVEPEPELPSASAKRKRKRLPRALRRQRTRPTREKPTERKPITRLPTPEHARGRRHERQGTVVSASSDKTIVVRVDVVKLHPVYKKVIRRSTKLHAHDERNEAKVGDVVRIVETRPLSRMKRWRLQEIVEAAK